MALAMFIAPTTRGRARRGVYSIPQSAARLATASGEPASRSLPNTLSRGLVFQGSCLADLPKMASQVNTKLNDRDAFAFQKLPLEQSVWSTNEDFSAVADHAVPGNSFSGRSGSHGASGCARAPRQAQSPSEGSIS